MDRKARVREYLETPRPAGVYCVRNVPSGKLLLGSSTDLPGILNRQRFQLNNGSHPDKELPADWNELGQDQFAFEVLDELSPARDPARDPAEDLRVLKALWMEKLMTAGASLCRQSSRGT